MIQTQISEDLVMRLGKAVEIVMLPCKIMRDKMQRVDRDSRRDEEKEIS